MLTAKPQNRVNWGAFLIALVGAPLIPAILGFWMLYIPAFAVVLGAPTYLLFGAPAFALTIRFGFTGPWVHMLAGLCAHIASIPVLYLYFGLDHPGINSAEVLMQFGFVFAPLWGLVFGLLYSWIAGRGR